MERNTESRTGRPYSFRHRSRGAAPKESSGILAVEHRRNNSIKEQFGRKKLRSSSRTRRRPSHNERRANHGKEAADRSSDESLEEGDERNRRGTSRMKSEYKVSEDMIGVPVPRRARSACAKRPQESFAVLQQSSCSSPVHNSAASSSSPSPYLSKKNLSPIKHRHSKMSKVSISESEAEVVQFLCGLKKLSSQHSPTKLENFQSSSQLDFDSSHSNEGYVSVASIGSSLASTLISLPLSSQTSRLPNHSTITSETGMVPKRKKPRNLQSDDAENPSVMISCNSKPNEDSIKRNATNSLHTLSTIEVQEYKNLHIIKARNSLPKLDKEVLSNGNVYSRTAVAQVPQNPILLTCQVDGKASSADPVCSKLLMSPELKEKPGSNFSNKLDGGSSSNFQAALEQTNQMDEKEANPLKQNLSSLPSLDDKLDTAKNISPVAASVERVNGVEFEIDHMDPPVNTSPNSNDCDASVVGNPQVSQNNHGHASCESHNKRKAIINLADKMAIQGPKAKKDSDIIELEKKSQMKMEAAEVATLEKQPLINGKFGSCHVEHNQNKVNMMQNPQKTPEGATRLADGMGQSTVIRTSTSTPIPITIPMWPGGLPPFGFLGCCLPIPRAHPHEPEEGRSANPYMPFVMIPPRQPGHCATHCFIAQFIHFQQQMAKINPLCHASDYSLCSARPFSLNTGTLLFGGLVVKNSNFLSINNFGPTFGGPVVMNPEAIRDPKICQASVPHLAHQGAAFMSPISRSRAAGPKAIDSEYFGSLSTLRASSAASASASANNNFSNFAGMQDPRFFTMFQSCPFPILPSYQAPLSQQQQLPPPPLPSNSSRSFQLQSQTFQQSHNSTSSIGSSSPQKHLQLPPCFPSSRPPPGTCHNEPEDGADSEVSLSQKKLRFVSPIANIVGKHHDPGDPSPQMSLKTIEVDIPTQPRQEIGSHQHYQLSNLQKHQKAPLKVHNTNKKSSVSDKVLQPSVPSTRYSRSNLSLFVSTESSMVYTDCNALIYCKSSGSVALHDTKNAQCNIPLSQKMPNHETSSVNSSSRKIRTMPTVSTHSVQAQSLAKAKQLLIPKSNPGHHNSAAHVMFAGSLNARKPTTNQQSQTSSSMQLTMPDAVCYLPSTAQVPSFSPLSNSSVAHMTAVSYAQATAALPVKSPDSKPTIV